MFLAILTTAHLVAPAPHVDTHAATAVADSVCGRVTVPASIGTEATRAEAVFVVTLRSTDGTIVARGAVSPDGRFVVRTEPLMASLLVVADGMVGDVRVRAERSATARPVGCALVLVAATATSTATLKPVAIQERRTQPRRTDGSTSDLSGAETFVNAMLLTPEQQGDPAAAATFMVGLLIDPAVEGIGALRIPGAEGASNAAALNGITGLSGQMPRDVAAVRRLAISPFDPARGGFAGAFMSTALSAGTRRGGALRATYSPDTPAGLGAAASRLGATSRDARLSGTLRGPYLRERVQVNAALEYANTRRTAPFIGSTEADDAALLGYEVPWTLAAQSFLARLPAGAGRTADDAERRALYGALRLDFPRVYGQQFALHSVASRTQDDGTGRSITQAPSLAMRQTSSEVAAILEHVYTNTTHALLVENRFAVVRGETERRGGVPFGVLLERLATSGAELPGPRLAFGGPATPAGRALTTGVEARSDLGWIPRGSFHAFALQLAARRDAFALWQAAQSSAAVTFVDTAALLAGAPSVVSRRQLGGALALQATVLSLAASDLWRIGEHVAVQYGVRAHADVPDASSLQRNARLATMLDVSPRLSFRVTRPRANRGLRRTLAVSGGIGRFRDTWFSQLASAAAGRGAASVVEGVCLHPTPIADDWTRAERIESLVDAACPTVATPGAAEGAGVAPPLASTTAYAPSYRPMSSWRSQLLLAANSGSRLTLRLELAGAYARVSTLADANLRLTPVTTLADGRPLFVPADEIDVATGMAPLAASRRDRTSGRAFVLDDDARTWSARLSPSANLSNGPVTVAAQYSLATARRETRMAPVSTVDGLGALDWGPSATDARHQLVGAVYVMSTKRRISVVNTVWLRSGTPFSPVVRGDLNGDGQSGNDRPHLDAALVERVTMQVAASSDLASTDRDRAIDCLRRARGAFARPGSCRSAWSGEHAVQAYVGIGPSNPTPRGYVLVSVAGLDRAFNGGLFPRSGAVDPVVADVTGFDPAGAAYVLTPNAGFGSRVASVQRAGLPPRMTMEVRWSW